MISGEIMKLTSKALIVLGISFLIFIVVSYVPYVRNTWINLISIILIIFFFLSLTFRFTIVSKINQLNKGLNEIKPNLNIKSHLHISGKDEIGHAALLINQLLDQINKLNLQNEKQHVESLDELQKVNTKLKHAIADKETEEKKLFDNKECLTQLARYDNLTALPNRIFFNEILNKAIYHAKRHQKILAILYIDLDKFKKINTDLGHTIGDHVLKEISNRLSNVLRAEDILAKLDADEFIVLLNDIGKPKFASTVAEKLLRACSQPLKIDAHDFTLTASIGISIYPTNGDSLEILLKNVEIALQKAKSMHGNAYQFFNQEMDIEAHEYIQLEAYLRKAIQNKELALYYQPKLHLRKGNICGVEALTRWTHPELGIINPSKFIPLAEETGLIMEIGEWSLYEACKTNKYWQDEGYEHLTVSVNLSPKQFYHPDIHTIIANVLKNTNLSPEYLEVEINESTIMHDIEYASKKLQSIKETNVLISLDHFGVGYTSISHLKQLPVNTLKIDKNFIKGIPLKPDDLAITSAVIALAHNLGLEVVAEGVETAEQVQHLAAQNCDMVQGYFISHPLPAAKIVLQFKKLLERIF